MSLKASDVRNWLIHHKIEPSEVHREKGVRVVLGSSDEAFIEVVIFKRDKHGMRFIDSMTGHAAVETKMVPLQFFPEKS